MTAPTLEQRFTRLFLAHEPTSKAKMLQPGATGKYYKVKDAQDRPLPITEQDIADLLAGRATFGVPLIGAAGLAYWAAGDIDHGGAGALTRMLEEAARRGVRGFAITSTNDEHDGGWVWFHFAEFFTPERGRLFINEIAAAAGVEVEAYPSGKSARLPGGKHTWSNQRGRMLQLNAPDLDLDLGGKATLAQMLDHIEALAGNPVACLPTLPEATPGPVAASATYDGPSPIATFNNNNDLIAMLGGRVAQNLPNGGALLHCSCPAHKHRDTKPSLEVKPSSRPERYGPLIAYGYSPGCLYYTERGQVIAPFDAYRIQNGLTDADAVQSITPARTRTPRRTSRTQREPEQRHEPSIEDIARRVAEREQRVEAARAAHDAIRERAEADTTLSERARLVLDAFLTLTTDRNWGRPSIARLMELTGFGERRVQRALADLKARGYIEDDQGTSKGGASTTIRRLKVSPVEISQNAPLSPELKEQELILNPESGLVCEGPRDSQRAAPVPDVEPVYSEPGGAFYDPAAAEPFDSRGFDPWTESRRAWRAAWEGWAPPQRAPQPEVEQHELVADVTPATFKPLADVPAKQTQRKRTTAKTRTLAAGVDPNDSQVLKHDLAKKRAQLPSLEKQGKGAAAAGVRRSIEKLEQQLASIDLPVMDYQPIEPVQPTMPSPSANVSRAPSHTIPRTVAATAEVVQVRAEAPASSDAPAAPIRMIRDPRTMRERAELVRAIQQLSPQSTMDYARASVFDLRCMKHALEAQGAPA